MDGSVKAAGVTVAALSAGSILQLIGAFIVGVIGIVLALMCLGSAKRALKKASPKFKKFGQDVKAKAKQLRTERTT